MEFIYLIFYACLRLQFLDVETNPGPQHPVPAVCRILSSNVPGQLETLVTWPCLCLSIIYCFAPRLWSQICITCRSCWFPVSVTLSYVGVRTLGPMGWQHMYEMVMEHFTNPNLSMVVAKCWFLGFVVWGRTFMCNLYRNPDIDQQIFDFFTSINSCCAGRGCPCLFPVCGWFQWPSSGVVRFYDHEPSWSCSLWLRKSPVAISWLSAQPMLVVEYLTSWWLMFLT